MKETKINKNKLKDYPIIENILNRIQDKGLLFRHIPKLELIDIILQEILKYKGELKENQITIEYEKIMRLMVQNNILCYMIDGCNWVTPKARMWVYKEHISIRCRVDLFLDTGDVWNNDIVCFKEKMITFGNKVISYENIPILEEGLE